MLDELSFARLHAVCDDEADVFTSSYPLESHYHLCDLPTSLIELKIVAPQVLTKGVHNDEFEVWQSIHNLIEFISEQVLIAVIEDTDVVDAWQDLVDRELVSVLAMLSRVLVYVLKDFGSQTFSHLSDSLHCEITVCVDEKSLAIYTAKSFWDLNI